MANKIRIRGKYRMPFFSKLDSTHILHKGMVKKPIFIDDDGKYVCPICGGNEFIAHYGYAYDNQKKKSIPLYLCNECGYKTEIKTKYSLAIKIKKIIREVA